MINTKKTTRILFTSKDDILFNAIMRDLNSTKRKNKQEKSIDTIINRFSTLKTKELK